MPESYFEKGRYFNFISLMILSLCIKSQAAPKIFQNKFCKLTLKGALYGLRQFLGTESPLKIMKNAFYFILEALFVLKIFEFLF